MNVLSLLGLSLLSVLALQVGAQGSSELSREALKKMKVSELKKMLADRGQVCDGCAEKADYVDRVAETQHMPTVVPRAPEPKPDDLPPGVRTQGREPPFSIDDIMKQFQHSNERQERIKKMLADRGYDPALAEKMSLSGMGDKVSDEQAVDMIIRIAGAEGAPKGGRKGKNKAKPTPEPEEEVEL